MQDTDAMFNFDSQASTITLNWVGSTYWSDGNIELSSAQLAFAKAQGFDGKAGQLCILPSEAGAISLVLFGGGGINPEDLEALPNKLPSGIYDLSVDGKLPPNLAQLANIWADGHYKFTRYKSVKRSEAILHLPIALSHIETEAHILHNLRDWVNTPAEDMHPEAFADVMFETAKAYGATYETIVGDDLLSENYPMIHAVGRAGHHAPRYSSISWKANQTDLPLLALIGKGVCFDSGGLNIKTGNFMRLMKKDMGGAAHVLALAQLIMSADLPVRLYVGIPLVENNIAANAFRPGDVLPTRKGLNIEIDNTDAEGRLVLADGLARACELTPDLLLDFATLTGAARVALGPDFAPIFTDDKNLANSIVAAGEAVGDPVWHLPLWSPYKRYLQSSVSDMQNAGGRMAGAITAGIFLQAFVDAKTWAHFDVWSWREAKNGQPQGGYPIGIRAVWSYLQDRYISA